MNLRQKLKHIPLMNDAYKTYISHTRLTSRYKIFGNIKNSENLVIILAGYKEFLWNSVFYRLDKLLPKDNKFEVCIVSSGIYSEKLKEIAQKHNWVYMSVTRNNVCLAQNTAINAFPNAKYIYKIDEDMFLTDGFFTKLKNTYNEVNKNTNYTCGFVTPLIPINGVGYVEILKKYNKIKEFEERFHERVKYSASQSREIVKNPKVAEYFWGNASGLPSIDNINKDFNKSNITFKISPNLYSIGAILFERKFWQDMNMFPVSRFGTDMGLDEYRMNAQSFCDFKAVVISMKTVVGHFSYGPQTKMMREFYNKHPENFDMSNEE